MGIAHLILMAMEKEGISRADAIKKIWMVDSKGLIVKVNSSPKLSSTSQHLLQAKERPEQADTLNPAQLWHKGCGFTGISRAVPAQRAGSRGNSMSSTGCPKGSTLV